MLFPNLRLVQNASISCYCTLHFILRGGELLSNHLYALSLNGTQGVTYQLTQGVVKNIIPAIPSTNAIVAAACTLEALKMVTMCSTQMQNYMMCALSSCVAYKSM